MAESWKLQRWRFIGGPLHRMVFRLPIQAEVPAELVFREDEIAPGWDAVYRRRFKCTIKDPITWTFDYNGDTEGRRNEIWYRQQFAWRNEEIMRLKNRLERQNKWLAKLRGTIKGMKARAAKRRGPSPDDSP